MPRLIRFIGPSDVFDARQLFARDDDKYLIRRGQTVEVTNDEADELLSFPRHQFVEVDPTATAATTAAVGRRARAAAPATTSEEG